MFRIIRQIQSNVTNLQSKIKIRNYSHEFSKYEYEFFCTMFTTWKEVVSYSSSFIHTDDKYYHKNFEIWEHLREFIVEKKGYFLNFEGCLLLICNKTFRERDKKLTHWYSYSYLLGRLPNSKTKNSTLFLLIPLDFPRLQIKVKFVTIYSA